MDPFQYGEGLEGATEALSGLSDDLGQAHDRLNNAEDEWLKQYDFIAQELKDQMVEEKRKGDPAEHVVVSTTRRRFPEIHREYREAKRQLDLLNTQSSNRRSELTGFQSLIKSEHAIAGSQDQHQQSQRGLPQHLRRAG